MDVFPQERFLRTLDRQGVSLTPDEIDRVYHGRVIDLLTSPTGNPKAEKGMKKGVATAVLHLMPADSSGFQVCPLAKVCKIPCLTHSGRGGKWLDADGLNAIQRARRRKTHWWIARRTDFLARLVREVELHERNWRAKGYRPAVRLNGTSDIRWETIPVVRNGRVYPNIMRAFPRVTFYDYTKIPGRTELPRNYSLTFSFDGTNGAAAEAVIETGGNVAIVVRTPEIARRAGTRYARLAPVPTEYNGRPAIDGDESDLRFTDPAGAYVLLRAKGPAVKDTSGFVRDLAA